MSVESAATPHDAETPACCLTPRELARRWRCRVERVRRFIREGTLEAIAIGNHIRITPEAIHRAETAVLAVRPPRRRRREAIPREVEELLEG